MNMSYPTGNALPSPSPSAHTDTGGGPVRGVTAGQRVSAFDKDSEIDCIEKGLDTLQCTVWDYIRLFGYIYIY